MQSTGRRPVLSRAHARRVLRREFIPGGARVSVGAVLETALTTQRHVAAAQGLGLLRIPGSLSLTFNSDIKSPPNSWTPPCTSKVHDANLIKCTSIWYMVLKQRSARPPQV